MECKTKKTIVVELTVAEAFSIKSMLEVALPDLAINFPTFVKHGQNLVDLIGVEDVD